MFNRNVVLYLTREFIYAQKSRGGEVLKVRWDGVDPTGAFVAIKKRLKPGTVKVVIGEGLSYALAVIVPFAKNWTTVANEASKSVPEHLTKHNFAWKLIGDTKDGSSSIVEVIAISYTLANNLSYASKATKIGIESLSPASLLLAQKTKGSKTPKLILSQGREIICAVCMDGYVYSSTTAMEAPAERVAGTLSLAAKKFSLNVSEILFNWDYTKHVSLSGKWKTKKEPLDPMAIARGLAPAKGDNGELVISLTQNPKKPSILAKEIEKELMGEDLESRAYDSSARDIGGGKGIMPDYSAGNDEEDAPKKTNKKLVVIGAVIMLVVAGFIVYTLLSRSKQSELSATPEPTETATLVPTATPEPTEKPALEEVELDLTDYVLQVQNGSGTPGLADEIVGRLEEGGFLGLSTANADNFEYIGATVLVKDGTSEKVVDEIADILDDYEVSRSEETLPKESEFDIIVIVGLR